MQAVAKDRAGHAWTPLAVILLACLTLCASSTTAASFDVSGVTLRLEPRAVTVKEGEDVDLTVVFIGGAQETTLILPMGADPSGIISFRVTDVASGRAWTAARRDRRSFAADGRQRLAVGGKLELHYQALEIRGDRVHVRETLPAGTYRFAVTYDESRTFRPENRALRVLRSEPVQIVVTPR